MRFLEIDNILDALSMDGVEEIIQYCDCNYNGVTIEFKLINDDIGVIDEIEYLNEDGEYKSYYDNPDDDESISMIVDAVENAPMEVFHKSDVGAKLQLNHESIKQQNVPSHFRTEFYVDDEGPILLTLKKNVIELD